MEHTLYQVIEDTREFKKISYKKLAEQVGLTTNGIFQGIKNRSLRLSTYLKICEALEIKPFKVTESAGFANFNQELEEIKNMLKTGAHAENSAVQTLKTLQVIIEKGLAEVNKK